MEEQGGWVGRIVAASAPAGEVLDQLLALPESDQSLRVPKAAELGRPERFARAAQLLAAQGSSEGVVVAFEAPGCLQVRLFIRGWNVALPRECTLACLATGGRQRCGHSAVLACCPLYQAAPTPTAFPQALAEAGWPPDKLVGLASSTPSFLHMVASAGRRSAAALCLGAVVSNSH